MCRLHSMEYLQQESPFFCKSTAWSKVGTAGVETLMACAEFLALRDRTIRGWMFCDSSVDGDEHFAPRDSQANTIARDIVLNFPQGGVSFSGLATISDWFLHVYRTIPDLHLTVHQVIVSPQGAQVSYRVSGTQLQPLVPIFPLGKFIEWEFVSVLDFDEAGLVSKELMTASWQPGPRCSISCGLADWAPVLVFTQPGSRLMEAAIEAGEGLGVLHNLHGQIVEVAQSDSGNHVLEKYIVVMPPAELQFIVDEVVGRAAEMASHRTACRIVQRLIQHCPLDQVKPFVPELLEQAVALLTDRYGNFVLQRILEHGDASTRHQLIELLCSLDTVALAQHWIANHVVCSAFVHASCEEKARLAHAVAPTQRIWTKLLKHRHGSFVAREIKFMRGPEATTSHIGREIAE